MRFWAEYGEFFREFRRDFHHTGAVLPSGRFLAHALASALRGSRSGSRILEVGPGTGSVTRAIARRMAADDHLDAVEINRAFAHALRSHVDRAPVFQEHRRRIEIIHSAVEDLGGESIYDYIISGLPLNNFSAAQVRGIFAAFGRLLKPGGMLSYFEYTLVRQLKAPFVNRRERRRLFRVGRIMGGYIRDFQVRRERVFINVPPAIVRHLQLKPAALKAHAGQFA
jgi:phospholipid N-methyltransferase